MDKKKFKKIAVFTSGGDAPGMNAAVRSVTRTAINKDIKVVGINYGYSGMINDDFRSLKYNDVSGIIQQGGTILKTARCEEFKTTEGRKTAYDNLKKHGVDGVIVVGGDGSFRGAAEFTNEYDIPFIGIPGTIDNDIYGTDYTIGYDTALNTVTTAVDKIKDTANSHGRIFFVEAMGRDAGLLALESGIACGAEVILIPEILNQEKELKQFVEKGMINKKTSGIVMVAEGDEMGSAIDIAKQVQNDYPDLDVKVVVLGHIQRGGSPSAKDRVAATRMGMAAVHKLLEGKNNIMVGLYKDNIVEVPLKDTSKSANAVNKDFLKIQRDLSIISDDTLNEYFKQ